MMRYAYAICLIMYMPNNNLSFKYLMPPGPEPKQQSSHNKAVHDMMRSGELCAKHLMTNSF